MLWVDKVKVEGNYEEYEDHPIDADIKSLHAVEDEYLIYLRVVGYLLPYHLVIDISTIAQDAWDLH